MAIVKIFPNDPKKSDFSVRFFATKFHLFEGDKILRSSLKSVEQAEEEMEKIVAERIKAKLTEVTIHHNGAEPEKKELKPHKRVHNYKNRACLNCAQEFESIRSNHVYCSRECANSATAKQFRFEKQHMKDEKNEILDSKARMVDITELSHEEINEFVGNIGKAYFKIENEKEAQKTFDDLGKQAQVEKKRENFVSDLLDCIALQVEFEVMVNGKIDWDSYYKALIRLNLVYFNGANMFTALNEIFGVDNYKKPIVLSSILNPSTVETAKKQGIRFMMNMNTFPSHAQHSALATLSLNKVVIQNLISKMKSVSELDKLVKHLLGQLETLKDFNTDLATNTRSNANSLIKLNERIESLESMNNVKFTSEKSSDPFNQAEPIIRDYMKEESENKVPWWKKMFKF